MIFYWSISYLSFRNDFEDYSDLLEVGVEEEEYTQQGQQLAHAGMDPRCVFPQIITENFHVFSRVSDLHPDLDPGFDLFR